MVEFESIRLINNRYYIYHTRYHRRCGVEIPRSSALDMIRTLQLRKLSSSNRSESVWM